MSGTCSTCVFYRDKGVITWHVSTDAKKQYVDTYGYCIHPENIKDVYPIEIDEVERMVADHPMMWPEETCENVKEKT